MLAQIPRPLGSTALVATLLVWAIAFQAPTVTRADDCLTAPNSAAPAGSHWYYHMDSAKQRKCWYVRAADQSAQHAIPQPAPEPVNAVVQPASDPANAARQTANPPGSPRTTSIALPRPAAGSARAPLSITPGDSTPPLPRIKMLAVKPQRAVSGVITSQPLEQSAQQPQASSTSSIPETPGPATSAPLSNPSQTRGEEVATATAATPVWPDPRSAALAPQEPTAVPADTATKSAQTKADAEATSESAGSASQDNSSMTNAGIVASLTSAPVTIFPVAALGLVVVGFFLRFVMKISLAPRQRIAVDRHHSNWTDERSENELRDDQFVQQQLEITDYLQSPLVPTQTNSRPLRSRRIDGQWPDSTRARDPAISPRDWIKNRSQHGWNSDQQPHDAVSVDPGESNPIQKQAQPNWHEDQQQYGWVKEGDELMDDLPSSQMAATSDDCPDGLLPANDGWSHSGHRKDDAAQMSEQIREREEVLETLRRDLDRLLRSPKVA